MPRTTKPLTDTEVKQAKSKPKEYNLADGKGLYLRVKPSGTKLWIFNYTKPFNGKRANISLGQYPTLSLAKARLLRQGNLELLSDDIDPHIYRLEQQRLTSQAHENTFKEVARKWFRVKKSKVTKDYAEDLWRSLELHLFPELGDIPVHSIRARNAIEILTPISAKGSLETVKRLCQRLNEIMVYAVNTGLIDANPLTGISKAFQAPYKKHMPTLRPDELPNLMAAVANASIKKTTRCLIEWQLQTMTRPSEAAGTRWEEINIEDGLWTIPAERMKKKRAHTIPLSPQALSLLGVMRPISGHREHVFPADRDPRTHIHEQTANMALKRMGFGGLLVAHGLRSLASTTLNEQGFDPDIVEAALAHTDKNDVRAAYNRADYLDRREKMMRWWSDHIDLAAAGSLSLSTISNRPEIFTANTPQRMNI
jgi:integrase